MISACVLTGIDWWTTTIPVALLTLACRWIAVGVWQEVHREREREQRRQWLRQLHDRDRRHP